MNCEIWARFYGWGFLKWEDHPWSITLICSFTQQVFKYSLSITVRVGQCCRWSRQSGNKKKSFIWETYSVWCSHAQGTEFRCYDGRKAQDLHCSAEDRVPCPDPRWRYFQDHPRAEWQLTEKQAHWEKRQDEGKNPTIVGVELEAERIKSPSYVEI